MATNLNIYDNKFLPFILILGFTSIKKKHLDSVGLLRKLNCGCSKAIILVQLRNGAPWCMEGNEIPAPTLTKKGGSEALPMNF